MTFNLYDNSAGTGTPLFTDTEPLSGGSATSTGYTPTATGTDYWVATYNGDGNNSAVSSGAAAEPVAITGASPSITTTQQPASATVGSPIKDMATMSGGDSPTGTVTFNLYDNSAGTGTPLFTDADEPLSGGSATSTGYTPTATGTDYWVATYNGDGNNSAVSSGAAAEPVAITGASPSITTTQQPASATVGSPIKDMATMSGGDSPTGTVTFNLYDNSAGTGTPLFTDADEPLSGGSATSTGYTPTATGTDYWVATYNGDGNNSAVSSGAAAEPVTITPAAQHITFPALRNRSIVESPFAIVGVTGGGSGQAVTFTASGGKCTVSGKTVKLLKTGTCTITAHQAGNANYTAAPNVSRSFTISAAPSLRIGDANTLEGNSGSHLLNFKVTLSKPVSVPVTVHWTTANGSATAPSDYTASSGTLTFAAGQSTATISVAVKGDRTKEPSEVFFVLLNQPHNATISDPNASGGIINDD